jgi:hypothetical protein
MAGSASVTVLLVGDLAAIRPLYGDLAADLVRIEAGAMAQLLADAAAGLDFGLCAIGWLDLAPLAGALRLTADHMLLHALVGGEPASTAPAMKLAEPAPAEPAPSPEADLVALVRGAWEEVLACADFADTSSFFEVGGNSFLAVALQVRLAALVSPAPSVTDLFRYPTVQALAAHLAAQAAPAAPPDIPVPRPADVDDAGVAAPDPHATQRARRLAARQLVTAGGRP